MSDKEPTASKRTETSTLAVYLGMLADEIEGGECERLSEIRCTLGEALAEIDMAEASMSATISKARRVLKEAAERLDEFDSAACVT